MITPCPAPRALYAAITAAALSISLSACQPAEAPVAADPAPQDVFFDRLSELCGKAYSGQMVSDQEADADMAGRSMIMHVTHCDQNEIRIPFHVGPVQTGAPQTDGAQTEAPDDEWDRSRTWIITRNPAGGLRLKHRHRHEDGSLDSVTNYGGDTAAPGSEERQEFPVDNESIALFRQEGLDQSVTNVWAVEVSAADAPDARFAYELRRPPAPAAAPTAPPSAPPASDPETSGAEASGRLFRVEFDLSQPVPAPPPVWGDEG